MRLNLGCGLTRMDGMVNVDIADLPGVDVVADLDQPWPWPDGSVTEIIASHLYEHVADPVHFMSEAWRVLADDGVLDIRVPGGSYIMPGYWLPHQHSFSDPTHRRHCTPLTFDYWVPGKGLHEAYGAGFGSGPGGPRFRYKDLLAVGAESEELRAILIRLP
jgi:Methyltransferase domain